MRTANQVNALVAKLASACRAVMASPAARICVVGITSAPKLRRSAFNKVGYDHLVVLAEGLKPNEALLIERGLFKAITEDRRRATYRRYHPKNRDGPYRASLGGKQTSDSPDWEVYLAWKCCSAIT